MKSYERYELGVGSMVVFTCTNPAVGFIKRMAKNKSWADVYWVQGLGGGYASRVDTKNLRPLNGVLNYWMEQSGHTNISIKNANGNYYLPPGT